MPTHDTLPILSSFIDVYQHDQRESSTSQAISINPLSSKRSTRKSSSQ
ncbi:MAG: hypothetical protein Sylvanvirus28_8 [Sylvanvirus sp.]|uniref:Uncharacterized protein n=1 Tax=Sylvanvirus sp. TaxID=2487774 RepID=A0A3G5AJU4_9VIRU|nr:MAG: hypothetical protein Sylvanvirus28_8 [Sylvanvirus sp.]